MIEHLLSHEVREAHNSRLKLYAESSYMVSEEIHELISEQGMMVRIREIAEIKYDSQTKEWIVYVFWAGLEDIEATWERLRDIARDAPDAAKKFISSLQDRAVRKQVEKDIALK
ncbi:Aste57867_23613 [Aphanomyces stellatus]|uniref:Aste57867_23613 protein n=1 Tax=Aphanomyces stellatus TaxID=120398 RepID=A0A485LN51_9STRA|nr:hypothetical protein As57867_023541 [Aphanomyces stellatus]VFU00258.1 Aste57867_23613 [Aphanomyces stellatus]